MFGENSQEAPSFFKKERNVKKEPVKENRRRIFDDDFDIDEFFAEEIDELTSPKLELPEKSSKSKYSSIRSRRRKDPSSFSLFPNAMLQSNNILKKSSRGIPEDVAPVTDDEFKANSYMLPSEDTYNSYDIPHHAKKRFSDFGSLVGYERNRRQRPPPRSGSRSNRVPEKKRPQRPPPVQRYPSKPLAGSSVKHAPSHWSSHKVHLIFISDKKIS